MVSPSGSPFNVGIEDPDDPRRVAAVVPCRSGGVATSGTAARGEHVYNPRSGAAAVGLASVTVIGQSLETADVLATAAFVAGERALGLVATVEGYQALCIWLDGGLSSTEGWPGSAVDADGWLPA